LTARRWRRDLEIVHPIPGGHEIDVRTNEVAVGPDGASILFDAYVPAGSGPPRPIVVFVHGDADPQILADAKSWGQFTSWGRMAAAHGMVGITFNHSSVLARTRMDLVIAEITAVIEAVRARASDFGADAGRLAVWSCSAGAPYGLTVAYAVLPAVRCAVACYGPLVLELDPDYTDSSVSAADLERCGPTWLLEALGPEAPPTLILKAALDRPAVNAGIDAFVQRAGEIGAPVEVIVHEAGHHAFDVLDDDDRSREIIAATMRFLEVHLGAVTA
jgi:acetyl esterase/lipase